MTTTMIAVAPVTKMTENELTVIFPRFCLQSVVFSRDALLLIWYRDNQSNHFVQSFQKNSILEMIRTWCENLTLKDNDYWNDSRNISSFHPFLLCHPFPQSIASSSSVAGRSAVLLAHCLTGCYKSPTCHCGRINGMKNVAMKSALRVEAHSILA